MSDPQAKLSLRLLSLSYFTMGTGTLAVIGTLPVIASSLSLGRGAIAMLVSILSITFAICAPLLQMVVGHWPRRRLILAGLTLMAVGSFGTALAPNYPMLVAARVITGVGAAAIGPVASALGASLVPLQKQGHALAVVFSGMTIASVVGVPLSAWLGSTIGWRPTFMLVGGATIVVAVLVGIFISDRQPGQHVGLGQLGDVLARPATAAGIAVMVFEMAGVFCCYTMIAPILQDRFGASSAAVSAALMVFGLAGIVGNVLARKISSIWSANRAIGVALLGLVLVFVGLLSVPGWFSVAIGLLTVWALANDVFMPSQQRRMVELAPQARGLVLALNASAIYVGMAAGSFASGSLYPIFGLTALPLASVGFVILSFGALWWSCRAAMARADLAISNANIETRAQSASD